MDPNLFFQKCKQQYWDKLNEPWVLVGAASSKHIKSSGVSRMEYPRGANRGRDFGAPGQIEEWRPSAEVLDGGRGLDARSDYFFFR